MESQARTRLLDAAVAHAMVNGIADLSLRELAAAIGTSHRFVPPLIARSLTAV